MADREEILAFLKKGLAGDLLPWGSQAEAARRFGLRYARIEEMILEQGWLPARYQRNRRLLSTEEQLGLLRSRVAVIGCGGLGGYVIEELARLGVGKIVAVDFDTFEEHNLNRQLLSFPDTLGQSKVAAAAERVARVNPAVVLEPVGLALTRENGGEILRDVQVAVDALDSISVRLELSEACGKVGIPMVHGAIAGWYGQIAVQFPGDDLLERVYGGPAATKGIEKELGNPSFTPAVVASLQAAEVCKLLLSKGTMLRGRILKIDLLEMEFHEIPL